MYKHHDSAQKAAWETTECSVSDAIHPDEKPMAWWNIREWAIKTIEGIVHKEANTVSSKVGGFTDKGPYSNKGLNCGSNPTQETKRNFRSSGGRNICQPLFNACSFGIWQ